MKQTVSIDARMIQSTGIGTYLRNLLENIVSMDNEFEFQILCSREENLSGLPAERFLIRETRARIYGLKEHWDIARLAASSDLLHCPHYNVPYFYRGRLVVTIHDLTHLLHRDFRPNRLAYPYARFMLGTATKRAVKIIANSRFTKLSLQERLGVPEDKIRTIYPAISKRCGQAKPVLSLSRLRELQINGPYVLFVGLLKPHKNLHRLIQAFATLSAETRNEYRLVIAGKKDRSYPDLKHLTSQVELNEKVVFTDYVSATDLELLYAGATAFVLPSLNEGFGLPALEAMAHGVPVIASNNSALPEVVGDAGLLIEPHSVESIADALRQVITNEGLRRDLAQRGQERARLFSVTEFAKRHLEVYREALRD